MRVTALQRLGHNITTARGDVAALFDTPVNSLFEGDFIAGVFFLNKKANIYLVIILYSS
jgi:hypothetical protein